MAAWRQRAPAAAGSSALRPQRQRAAAPARRGRALPPRRRRCRAPPRAALGVVYTSAGGATRRAAELIAARLGAAAAGPPIDLAALPGGLADLAGLDGLIVGAPTYNTGAARQRSGTAWDDALCCERGLAALRGKPFAVFGLGDAARFKHSFADAIGELHDVLAAAGAVPLTASYACPSDYLHAASKALRAPGGGGAPGAVVQSAARGGRFVGLPLDSASQPELTPSRVRAWCAGLLEQLAREHPRALAPAAARSPWPAPAAAAAAQPLAIGDWPAAWPASGAFGGLRLWGFAFTDRYYQFGDRWARFADDGFLLRAGFREHPVWAHAYADVAGVQVGPPRPCGAGECADVRVSLRGRPGAAVVLREVEVSRGGGCVVADFLRAQAAAHAGGAAAARALADGG
ncbi:Flavodoxin [Scenedesmus sp. PABB004]|nr:Flavodoxin [Scenedesmus sp. PABB004]